MFCHSVGARPLPRQESPAVRPPIRWGWVSPRGPASIALVAVFLPSAGGSLALVLRAHRWARFCTALWFRGPQHSPLNCQGLRDRLRRRAAGDERSAGEMKAPAGETGGPLPGQGVPGNLPHLVPSHGRAAGWTARDRRAPGLMQMRFEGGVGNRAPVGSARGSRTGTGRRFREAGGGLLRDFKRGAVTTLARIDRILRATLRDPGPPPRAAACVGPIRA
ncbi:hypothetical protein SKAU_G00081830 [Synaphobranchus kaupii]|uniref:Uncharacterized protein n=1 Tax=Synaphobranchus kaupii TaxID=118154 RepID=A0A9Q1FVU2_SYNKA|nr:hypothetical protein SKAU_G00081830 [Synaphobranchus kaupii]